MSISSSGDSRSWLAPWLGAVLFAVAYTQPPLYYSNQNQYFLHGLAQTGYGDLRRDWLANTADPTPAFTFGVEIAYRQFGAWPFHVAFFLLLMAYFLSLWAIAVALPFRPTSPAGRAALAAGLIASHAAILRVISVKLVGVDYPWYLQAGVANQYLLGAGLQPSVFGVLLLTALAAFAHGRAALAGLLAAAACLMHSTYLLPAGLLVAGMLVQLVRAGRVRAAIITAIVALVGVAPVIVYNLVTFAPADPGRFAEAQAVIAWVRIPHHTMVSRWFDPIAALQILWATAGLLLFRRTVLFVPLGVAAGLALLLSLVEFTTGNATLALLFPWRVSAVFVPLATAAVSAWLAQFVAQRKPAQVVGALSRALVIGAVGGALIVYAGKLGYQETTAEAGLQTVVAKLHRAGDVYLLPADYPGPPKTKGSAAATFVPVKPSDRPAIFELQRFRLGTGAAAYIDFKSIPYRDDEVLEWRRRMDNAVRWYAEADWDAAGVIDEITAEGVTHVVVPTGVEVHSRRLGALYSTPAYRVYRMKS